MSNYSKLVDELKRIHVLAGVTGLLDWDEQVNLPPDSGDFRARQSSALSAIVHREATQPRLGDWIAELEADPGLEEGQQLVVREARKDYDRLTRIPEDFVARKAAHLSQSYHAWAKARSENTFGDYAPFLEENLRLAKEEAAFLGRDGDPYDYWIDRFDPGMDAETIEGIFEGLKRELVPLVREMLDSPVKSNLECLKGFPEDRQEAFLREVTEKLGFNYSRGRIDRSLHPFCSGNAFDTRMTTRFFEDNPLDSLFSSIHETGHGLYEQGLPMEHVGTALGQAAGMAVHESQSRLWENQVARSREFWQYWEPVYRKAFPDQLARISSDELYLAVNSVTLNPIRVDSDEVTYNLHIIIRFELEQALINGSLAVADLPAAWNEKYREYLGVESPNHADGVLQDIHWSSAAIGYFPTYALGNLYAAQFFQAAEGALGDLQPLLATGDFRPLREWLGEKIYQHGQCYAAMELATEVSGKPLSHAPLMAHLRGKLQPLYGLD